MTKTSGEGGLILLPTTPSTIQRTTVKNFQTDPGNPDRLPIKHGRPAGVTLPDGWAKVDHPDSGVYYVHEQKILLTPSRVFIPSVHNTIMEAAESLQSIAAFQECVRKYREVGLVLDVNQRVDKVDQSCGYYLFAGDDRCVLWLEDKPIPCISKKCRAPNSSNVHCVTAQYWKHCELFPTAFAITSNTTSNLKAILIQAAGERVTSKFSTSPYSKEDLEYMLNLVNEIESARSPEKDDDVRPADVDKSRNGFHAWVIAKFMSLHNDGMLKSTYGQSDDYFDIEYTEESIGPYQRSWLMIILAPIMLRSADVYAEELYTFYDSFTPERWSTFVRKVDTSIRDSNLLATVMLSTSVSVLAIASVDAATHDGSRSAVQITIYVSIVCSVGSIIIGLAIYKQYRAKGADTPLRAVTVLQRILKERYGLERLAIICSLPYVLLMWSLIAFLGAFAVVFYDNTDKQVRIPVSIALVLVALALFSCLHTAGPPDKDIKKPIRERRRSRGWLPLVKWGTRKQDALPNHQHDAEK